ncbi:30S ribosomal protein S18, partial [Bienertia sinuspersici]
MVKGMEGLTDDERKALRGSKFGPLPPPPPPIAHTSCSSSSSVPRKLQERGGLDNLKPELIELAVKNAKET